MNHKGIKMNVLETMKCENTPGLSVAYFEKSFLEWTQCYGVTDKETLEEVSENSMFHACSMTKMITALCLLMMHEKNMVNLFNNVNQYLKSWQFPDNEFTLDKPVTIADLLAHQGGVIDSSGSFEPVSKGIRPENIDILLGKTPYNTKEVQASYVPQSKFEYSDGGYAVLEMLIEDISGMKYVDYVEAHIFKPLGLEHTFLWTDALLQDSCVVGHDSKGMAVPKKRAVYPNLAGAGLWTTPKEFSTIVLDLLKAHTKDEGVLLNKKTTNLMFKPYGCVDFAGLGVFLGVDDKKPYFISQGWGVGMQCKVIAYLNEQRGAVVMMNSEPGKDQSQSIVGMVLRDMLGITCQ